MSVVVTTGSRLHFGLLGFGHPGQRQWGGLGTMIDRPATKVRVTLADRLEASGPDAERILSALSAARNWSRSGGTCREVGAKIEVLEAPPRHVGLGSGTQLALAVGRALDELHGRTDSIESVAKRVWRTRRSSVGAWGFAQGGLIYERGKLPDDVLGQLGSRIALPEQWRFVLARPLGIQGVFGDLEVKAFQENPPTDPAITARLIDLSEKCILPAAAAGDIDSFGERLTKFNRLAGSWYLAIQRGPYLNAEVANLVDRFLVAGAKGAGQTSWGPTVFAVTPDERSALKLVADAGIAEDNRLEFQVVEPQNCGAAVAFEP